MCCHHSSLYQGSPNYGPRARSHFIRPQRYFVKNEKIINLHKICWFITYPEKSVLRRYPDFELLCSTLWPSDKKVWWPLVYMNRRLTTESSRVWLLEAARSTACLSQSLRGRFVVLCFRRTRPSSCTCLVFSCVRPSVEDRGIMSLQKPKPVRAESKRKYTTAVREVQVAWCYIHEWWKTEQSVWSIGKTNAVLRELQYSMVTKWKISNTPKISSVLSRSLFQTLPEKRFVRSWQRNATLQNVQLWNS